MNQWEIQRHISPFHFKLKMEGLNFYTTEKLVKQCEIIKLKVMRQLVVFDFGDRCWLSSHTAAAFVASSAEAGRMASFWLPVAAFAPGGMVNGEGRCCGAVSMPRAASTLGTGRVARSPGQPRPAGPVQGQGFSPVPPLLRRWYCLGPAPRTKARKRNVCTFKTHKKKKKKVNSLGAAGIFPMYFGANLN